MRARILGQCRAVDDDASVTSVCVISMEEATKLVATEQVHIPVLLSYRLTFINGI